ncbi:Os11g0220300 [Oryza sativa Japonica Group]|uniref:Expressed protein n=2 Tax=Oryza sativa subsp. japonica TaxID=39947 RepID=Q2R8Q9_ORYSJ|nr:expressed protein [Oryza sativa Japonica Group]BAF27884.1 Os11g0220300 [Oryza sativa Japonica Group]BAG91109.1 unnamed protein product [Oryza sativa Japonica Group]BAT13243.1 Os11g0220300 [Oryza sativa Japonica Group]|eukprot:NP_001067521.1 Os11g0220300 [Oryza sativa Japonica Group]
MAAFMASGRSTVAPSTTRSCRPAAGFVTPRSLFSWGGRSAPPPEFQYHDVAPPFPMSLVANTHLRGRELKCCYKATVDGFSATDFHRRCDFKGPCVVVGRTGGGVRFGGFSPEGYRSTDDYYDTLDAFLFYWPETDTDAAAKEAAVVVLPKVGGSGAALFDYARGGPQFCRNMNSAIIKGGSARDLKVDGCRDKGFRQVQALSMRGNTLLLFGDLNPPV